MWRFRAEGCRDVPANGIIIVWFYSTSTFSPWILMKTLSHASAKKNQKGFRVSNFALLFVVFKWHRGSKVVSNYVLMISNYVPLTLTSYWSHIYNDVLLHDDACAKNSQWTRLFDFRRCSVERASVCRLTDVSSRCSRLLTDCVRQLQVGGEAALWTVSHFLLTAFKTGFDSLTHCAEEPKAIAENDVLHTRNRSTLFGLLAIGDRHPLSQSQVARPGPVCMGPR